MPVPLLIFVLLVISTGVAVQLTGVYARKGDCPSCRGCGYDLSSHKPDNCPECNADLNESEAVVLGVRRTGLIWVGTITMLAGLFVLAIVYIRSPGFDRIKPVWVLRVEMAFVNDKGDERVIEELERRLQVNTITKGKARAIGRIAVDLVSQSEPTVSEYELLKLSAEAGGVNTEQALPIIHDLIGQWAAELDAASTFAHGNYLHSELLGALIRSSGIELAELGPILQLGAEAALKEVPDHSYATMCAKLVWHWWVSPSSPGFVTHEMMTELYQDFPLLRLEVRPLVARETERVPFSLRFALPPNVGHEEHDDVVVFSERITSLQVRQGETILKPKYSHFGSSSQTRHPNSYLGYITGSAGTTALIEGLQPGPAELEIEVHVRLIAGRRSGGDSGVRSELVDELQPIIDRTIKLSRTFEVAQGTAGEIDLVMPGDTDVESSEQLLDSIRVSDLMYLPSEERRGGDWPLLLHIGRSQPFYDHTYTPDELDCAFEVIASQDEQSWRLGSVVLRDINGRQGSWTRLLWQRNRYLVDSAGQRVPVPEPDLSLPLRVTLVPDLSAASNTVDITAIWGEEIDLGLFDAVTIEAEDAYQHYSAEELHLASARIQERETQPKEPQ